MGSRNEREPLPEFKPTVIVQVELAIPGKPPYVGQLGLPPRETKVDLDQLAIDIHDLVNSLIERVRSS